MSESPLQESSLERAIPRFALVIPCYHEEEGLPHVMEALDAFLASLKQEGRVLEDSFIIICG